MDHHNSPEALLDRLDGLLAATEVPASPSYGEDLNDSEYTVQYDQFRQVKVFIRKLTRLYFSPSLAHETRKCHSNTIIHLIIISALSAATEMHNTYLVLSE